MPRHRGHHPIQSHHPSQPEPSRQTFTHRQLTWGCFPKNHQDGQLKVTVTSGFLRNWNSSNCTTPPPFFNIVSLEAFVTATGVVTRSGSKHTTSGFLINKKQSRVQTNQTKCTKMAFWRSQRLYLQDMSNPFSRVPFLWHDEIVQRVLWRCLARKLPKIATVKQWSKLPHLQGNLGLMADGMSSQTSPTEKKHQPFTPNVICKVVAFLFWGVNGISPHSVGNP